MKFLRQIVSILMAIVLLAPVQSLAAGIRVPGTQISLQPPPEFSAATLFPGFEHANSGSSIMVTEIPGPLAEVDAGMTEDRLATRGMHLLQKRALVVAGQNARLLKIRQYVADAEYLKWLLLFGDDSASVMIAGSFPAAVDKTLGDVIKDAIQTVSWDKAAMLDVFDGLSFRIGESDDLKLAKRMSNMVILSRPGEFGRDVAGKPMLIAGSAISAVRIDNMAEFSRQRILQMGKIVDIHVAEGKPLSINGHDAYELVAEGRDAEHNIDMLLYQVIMPLNSSYLIIQGMVGKLQSKPYLKQFRQLANSLTISGD